MQFASRRTRMLGTALAGLMLAVGMSGAPGQAATRQDPSLWKPWVLQSADQFRLPAPAGNHSAMTKKELVRLERLQAHRTRAIDKMVHSYGTGAATIPWTKMSLAMILKHRFGPFPTRSERAYALLHIAMYDALVAAYDSRDAYNRARPAKLDRYLHPLLKVSGSPYPDVRSTIAGAAVPMLEYLFPGEPDRTFTNLENKIANAELYGGVNYPSDIAAAHKLGAQVAQAVITFASTDGSQNNWPGNDRVCSTTDCGDPTGFQPNSGNDCNNYPAEEESRWIPTAPFCQYPPTDPMVAHWKTWLMSSPDQMLSTIPPPLAYGSQ